VAKDSLSGVLFAFRLASGNASREFPLAGLHAGRRYRATLFSGAYLEIVGAAPVTPLTVTVAGRFQSELILVERMH
jgi:hypothetical protein